MTRIFSASAFVRSPDKTAAKDKTTTQIRAGETIRARRANPGLAGEGACGEDPRPRTPRTGDGLAYAKPSRSDRPPGHHSYHASRVSGSPDSPPWPGFTNNVWYNWYSPLVNPAAAPAM